MKVICDRSALHDAVSLTSGVVAARTPSNVLKCVHLHADDGVLRLSATDHEVGVRLGVEQVEIESPGEAVIPADKLNQIVRACDDPTLTLETADHTTNIKGANSHFKVFGYDPKEFPPVREFGDAAVDTEIPASTLSKLVARTLFAAASEHSRYAINGVLFDREKDKLRLVATDGRRLAMAQGPCTNASGNDTSSCIIPIKTLQLLNKVMPDDDTVVRMALDDGQVLIQVGEGDAAPVISSNLVEGAFPPFEDVIPRDQDKKASFDAQSLASAVRRAALLTNEESRGVRLTFEDGGLTLTSRAPEMGEAEIHLDVEDYQGDSIMIGFNPAYVTDALKVLEHDQVIFELKAPNKPGVLRMGTDFMYVLMPVNLS